MKKRFENAQVGDLVYCRLNGEGTIISVTKANTESVYPLAVKFKNKDEVQYTIDGKYHDNDIEPMLFYRSETDIYLTERPANWNDVKPGTMCLVLGEDQTSTAHRVKFRFVADGKPWFEMTETILRTFKHAEVVCDV